MRILMIHPHDIFSAVEPWSIRIVELARAIRERGHRVKVAHFPLEEAHWAERMHPHGFEILPLSRNRRRLLANTRKLYQAGKNADVLHIQKCYPHAALPALVAATLGRKPLHYDWDDWEYGIQRPSIPSAFVRRFLQVMELLLPDLADSISVASQELEEFALRLGCPAEKLVRLPVGVDLDAFSPEIDGTDLRRGLGLNGNVVLYVGQLNGCQSVDEFLKAARMVLNRRDEVHFLVVGGGTELPKAVELGRELELGRAVLFTGPVPRAMVPRYIGAADIAVGCFEDNRQQRSKSPLKIVEYMASGKAVVASRVGDVATMVDGAGILVPPNDPVSLAKGIEQLLDDPALRDRLGRQGREKVAREYTWERGAENLLRAYEVAVGRQTVRKASFWSRVRSFFRRNLELVGMAHGEVAFRGPRTVQVDPTNLCNNDCVACWCHSPLLGDQKMPPDVKRQTLPLDVLERLLDELEAMGTQEIYVAGGGEPFMHPRMVEFAAMIKSRGFLCRINTNFTLVNPKILDRLMTLKVDEFIVSAWSGDAEAYASVHPNKREKDFAEIEKHLLYLNGKKRGVPRVRLFNVLLRENYRNFFQMMEFACKTDCETIEFTLADIIPQYTDQLSLRAEDRQWLLEAIEKVGQKTFLRCSGRPIEIAKLDQFRRRVASPFMLSGEYDRGFIDTLPCTNGWQFSRIHADGSVAPCLKAHRYLVGNIYDQPFSAIWNSERQRVFRRNTNVYKKQGPFFRNIGNDPHARAGCYRGCDDLGRLIKADQKLRRVGPVGRGFLKAVAIGFGKASTWGRQ